MRSNWAVVVLLLLVAVSVLFVPKPKTDPGYFEGPFQLQSLPDPK